MNISPDALVTFAKKLAESDCESLAVSAMRHVLPSADILAEQADRNRRSAKLRHAWAENIKMNRCQL